MSDKETLRFIYNRLVNVHEEKHTEGYMIKLAGIVDATPGNQQSLEGCVSSNEESDVSAICKLTARLLSVERNDLKASNRDQAPELFGKLLKAYHDNYLKTDGGQETAIHPTITCKTPTSIDTIIKIRGAVKKYYKDLENRGHGGIAANRCMGEIQEILGMMYKGI